jgi:hypothetical protein
MTLPVRGLRGGSGSGSGSGSGIGAGLEIASAAVSMTVVSVAAACVVAEMVSFVACCVCAPEEEPPQAVIAVESTRAAVRTQRLLVRIRVLLILFFPYFGN